MTPERWTRVTELFDGACQLPPDTRDTWLERTCDDSELRKARHSARSSGVRGAELSFDVTYTDVEFAEQHDCRRVSKFSVELSSFLRRAF